MSWWSRQNKAGAEDYLSQRDQEMARERQHGRMSAARNRMMYCGLTCGEWLDAWYAKRNPPGIPPASNTESEHDDQNGRSAAGPEAAEVSAGKGMGDAAVERSQGAAGGQAGKDWIEQAIGPSADAGIGAAQADAGSWCEEAYPADQEAGFETPF